MKHHVFKFQPTEKVSECEESNYALLDQTPAQEAVRRRVRRSNQSGDIEDPQQAPDFHQSGEQRIDL